MGVAPNADLPSMRSVIAASMAADVMSRLGESTVGLDVSGELLRAAKNFDEGVTSVVLPELTTGAAQANVDNTAMQRNTALVAIILLH